MIMEKQKKYEEKYKVYLGILVVILLVYLGIPTVLGVQYHQQRSLKNDSLTTNIHSFIFRDYSDIAEDYIKSDKPLELYVQYDMYINSWNNNNPSYQVDYCNILVRHNSRLDNETTILLNQTYTESDTDLFRKKFFFTLADRESALIDIDCKFDSNRSLDTPSDFIIVTPTWECKACQLYEWSLSERKVIEAEIIGDNVADVSDYIKELVGLNFEIWITLFWIFLIFLALIPFSLIFCGIYWIYLYIKRMTQ